MASYADLQLGAEVSTVSHIAAPAHEAAPANEALACHDCACKVRKNLPPWIPTTPPLFPSELLRHPNPYIRCYLARKWLWLLGVCAGSMTGSITCTTKFLRLKRGHESQELLVLCIPQARCASTVVPCLIAVVEHWHCRLAATPTKPLPMWRTQE